MIVKTIMSIGWKVMQDEMNDLQYTRDEDPDILKVCRCRDCVHRRRYEQKYLCALTITELNCKEVYMRDNDFCSHAERRPDEQTVSS